MSEIIAWMVAGGSIMILLYAYILKLRTERERRLMKCAADFYKHVAKLLADPNMPLEAIDIIEFLNHQITNRSMAREIFFGLLHRRLQSAEEKEASSDGIIENYYEVERKDLLEYFVGACVSGVLSISYQDQLYGLLLRRLVFFDLKDHRERAPEVVLSLKASGIGGSGQHCAAAA